MLINYKELPFNPALRERARELRKNMTFAEVLLYNEIKCKKWLGLNFDRQKIIGSYIVDFYCPALGLVGGTHNVKAEYDCVRDEYLQSLGLEVVHLSDTEIKKCKHWQEMILYERTIERMKKLGVCLPAGAI